MPGEACVSLGEHSAAPDSIASSRPSDQPRTSTIAFLADSIVHPFIQCALRSTFRTPSERSIRRLHRERSRTCGNRHRPPTGLFPSRRGRKNHPFRKAFWRALGVNVRVRPASTTPEPSSEPLQGHGLPALPPAAPLVTCAIESAPLCATLRSRCRPRVLHPPNKGPLRAAIGTPESLPIDPMRKNDPRSHSANRVRPRPCSFRRHR